MVDQGGHTSDRAHPTVEARETQARVAALRDQLLGGRGPGASREELAANMHDRVMLGAIPAMVERELVARRTQVARGRDTTAAERVIDEERTAVAATVTQILERLAPGRVATHAVAASRRRVEVLLGVPDRRRDDAERATARNDIDFADPRWWRVLAAGAAMGAAGVAVAVASFSCRRQLVRRCLARLRIRDRL